MPTWFKRRSLNVATKGAKGNKTLTVQPYPLERSVEVFENDARQDERIVEDLDEVREEDSLHAAASVERPIPPTLLDSWIPDVIKDKEDGMLAMFNEFWREMENGPVAVQMLATDQEHSMLAMFREVGTTAADEFHAGRRALSKATMEQIKWAIQQAFQVWKQSGWMLPSSNDVDRNIFLPDSMFEI